jgi:hypothetical protein
MSDYYSKSQTDAQATVIGARIKTATNAETLAAAIDATSDRNILTDAERTKLSGLESSKFLGTFATSGAIPTVGAVAGSYADVDGGVGVDVERWVYDVDDDVFIKLAGAVGGETSSSIKTKYEANANTNAFTDAEKAKLAAFVEATDIADFTAAIDAALA